MGDTQGSGDLRQANPLNVDELVAAFLARLQAAHAQQNTSGRRGEYGRVWNCCHAAEPLFETPAEFLRAFGGAAHGCHHQPP